MPGIDATLPMQALPVSNVDPFWGANGQFTGYEFDSMEFSSLLTPFLETLDGLAGVDDFSSCSPSGTDASENLESQRDDQMQGISSQVDPGMISVHRSSRTIESPKVPSPNEVTSSLDDLLLQYDQEFCVLPLTSDFDANPFRCGSLKWKKSDILLHSILALSYRHINRVTGKCGREASQHKTTALKMLEERQRSGHTQSAENGLLEAVLILFTLNCSLSAYGSWTSQLHAAHRVLTTFDKSGGQRTPRVEAQISMLIWWDVTLALTTRKGCVLPHTYHSNLHYQTPDNEKAFYNVSGCPEELFGYMTRLAMYAREFELATTMTCVTFDTGPVLSVEQAIKDWRAPAYSDCIDIETLENDGSQNVDQQEIEEALNYKQDLHHCAEAWRYALLLYIERVFKWDRKSTSLPVLGLLARKALNHVSSCRRGTMLQKQLLLPTFLAGCETTNLELREQAKQYCEWWNDKTRYDMFLTAAALLEEVWAKYGSGSWWGSIMDEKCQPGAHGYTQNQYLLG
ncbi:hypothetical protein CGCSCA5_v010022 [Colletotrichum siamense]|nr:hypothetical protein CGCSCA5_v010022 [Colletotrichum siamense]